MKNLILILPFFFISCAVKYKTDRPENVLNKKEIAVKKAEELRQKALDDETNWQHQHYEQAIFKVKNPLIVESTVKLEAICGGGDFEFKEGYQLKPISYVKFKKNQIGIKTKSGFEKKVYVTKGVCRELALYKKKHAKQMRKSIKEMNLLYVYNVGTYVIDVTFNTKFKGVEFFVK